MDNQDEKYLSILKPGTKVFYIHPRLLNISSIILSDLIKFIPYIEDEIETVYINRHGIAYTFKLSDLKCNNNMIFTNKDDAITACKNILEQFKKDIPNLINTAIKSLC